MPFKIMLLFISYIHEYVYNVTFLFFVREKKENQVKEEAKYVNIYKCDFKMLSCVN